MRTCFLLALVLLTTLVAGCARPTLQPGGRTSGGYNARFHHDRLRLHLQDWGSTEFQTAPLDEEAQAMWGRLPLPTRRASILTWSRPKWKALPVHRLMVLRRAHRSLGPGYQTVSTLGGGYAYRRVDTHEPALFEAVVPTGGYDLIIALQIASEQVGGNRSAAAYLAENLPLIVASLRHGPDYVPFVPVDPFTLAADAFGDVNQQSGNYLLPLVMLRQALPRAVGALEQGSYWQALATYHSFLGAADSARSYFYRPSHPHSTTSAVPVDLVTGQGGSKASALEFIAAQATAHRFVLVNEAHTEPRHRSFVTALLPLLRKKGFTYLAVEALAEDSTLQRRGFPTLASGFYTREPTMANLLRAALALGFRLVAYDAQTSAREQDQARNLVAKTTARDPNARVLVLAGHGHINEALGSTSTANWLRQLTGQDPLTVNQTELLFLSVPGPPGAYVFVQADGRPWRPSRPSIKSDVYVYNAWREGLQAEPAAKSLQVSVPADSLLPNLAHVLHVYATAELQQVPNPVPICLRPVSPGALQPIVSLLPGHYQVQLRDQIGHVLWRSEAEVK